MGKEQEEQLKKKKQVELQVEQPTYEEIQNPAWMMVDKATFTSEGTGKNAASYADYNKYDIKQLRDELANDTGSKSDTFMNMYNSVNDLITLATTGGQYEVENKKLTADFFETFYNARMHVSHYLYTRDGFHWTGKGERRIQIVRRIGAILGKLNNQIEEYKASLTPEKARMLEYRQQNLSPEEIEQREENFRIKQATEEMVNIASTGEYGPKMGEKERTELAKKWIVGGYSETIRQLLDGSTMDELKNKDDFIAFIEDHNNRMLANRMTVSLLVDKKSKLTSDTPWVRNSLMQYVIAGLGEDAMFTLKPQEIADKALTLMDDYANTNKDYIERTSRRAKKFSKELHIPLDISELYEYPIMKQLIDESDDDEFDERIANLKERQMETDELLRQQLETRFSVATRDAIAAKLIRNLGALRIFGTETQITDQCDRFFSMIRYIAPLEYHIENAILNTMKGLKLDLSCRDHFVKTVSGGDPKNYLEKYLAGTDAIKKYAKNSEANTKTFLKKADDKSTMLTQEQWEVLEKLRSKCGEYDSKIFTEMVTNTMSAQMTGDKMSRREFLSKRDFKDAQKAPAILRKVKAEKKIIDSMQGTMENRFMFHLFGGSLDASMPYRKLDAVYKGRDKQLKVAEEREARRLEERTAELKNALRTHGLSVPEMKVVIERFKLMMMGLHDIDDDMNDDVKFRFRRINLERYGVNGWSEALSAIEAYAERFKDGGEPEEARIARERFNDRLDQVGKLYNSKYKSIADLLVGVPEVRLILMSDDESEFDKFLNEELEEKFGALAEAMNEEQYSVPEAIRKSYAYSYLREIYQGAISGNAEYFSDQLKGYSAKVLKVRPDGLNSAADNIKAAEKVVDKELSKAGIKGGLAVNLKLAVVASIYEMAKDPDGMLKLFDAKVVKQYAKEQLEIIRSKVKEDELKDDETIKKILDDGDSFYNIQPDVAEHEKIEKIQKEKNRGRVSRSNYLGIDKAVITSVRTGKSLIRVKARGDKSVSLDTALADKMRGLIKEYCGDLQLPQVLEDALVEEGASQNVKERLTGTRWWSGTLYKHAFSMAKMYDFLRQEKKDDPAMSEEEAQMFIVKNYSSKTGRKLFENAKGPDVAELRTTSDYKKFREDYKKLRAFESIEIDEPSLERERMEIASDLRTIFMTGVGSKSEDLGELLDRATKYIKYSAQAAECIRKRVERHYKGAGLSELYIDRQVDALREYYMNTIIGEIASGDKFVAKDWNEAVTEFYSDKTNREHIEFSKNSISSEEYKKASQNRVGTKISEKDISETIKHGELLFNGRLNKYEKLDEDQKKLFIIALMMMDKGAIGMGTSGTASLLAPKVAKAKENSQLTMQIHNYVAGGILDVHVDYREALYKLINYGKNNILDPEGFTFSVTAYNKAMQFAQAISAKRLRYGERDMDRLANGYTSINAAYVNYGKNNQQIVDSLPANDMTIDNVRKKLLSFADGDIVSRKDIAKKMLKAGVGSINQYRAVDRILAQNLRMAKIKKRLNKLSDTDLKVFTRLMQERTIFDTSSVDDGTGVKKVIDQEKRDALVEALSSDTKIRSEVLEGFDDPESCKQALTTALSFKLRDDLVLKGKTLTKGCFDSESFNRRTLVDWTLVEQALDLMDSIAEKKLAAHAMSHAVDYIAFSGNKAAVDEYVKLRDKYSKEKDKFKQDNFEQLIKEQAEKDDSEDITRAISGYHALTAQEKNLFFKVLARRDFLDISRINYKSSYMGWAEREFANKAGRDALIDEYIDSSLEGNIGIQLDDQAYYNAMATLFTTQVSDRTIFSKNNDLTKIFANERQLFRGRATAVDWKLFKRALQFVNRASEELEFAEGNAQLYRGAGELSKNGHINMNYSFLRKNIHRTGNHWARTITRIFAKTGKDIIGGYKITGDVTLDKIINIAGDAANTVDDIAKFMFNKDGLVCKGSAWLKRNVGDLKGKYKKLGENPTEYNISELGVKQKEKTAEEKAKEREEEAQRRAQLDYVDHLKEGMDNIIAQAKSAEAAFKEVADYLKTNVVANSDKLKWFREVKGVSAGQNADNLVVQETKNAPVDNSYGDWRDKAKKVEKTGSDVAKIGSDVYDIAKSLPLVGDGLKDIETLIKNSTQKIAYKFLNDALIHNTIDLTPKTDADGNTVEPDELALYKQNAENYAKETFTSILNATIGEENAQKLLEKEQYLHSIKNTVTETMSSVITGIGYVKRCADHAKNIALCAENIGAIKLGSKNAAKMRAEDEAKLSKAAQDRLSPEQAAIVEKIVSKHRALKGVAEDVVTAVQAFNISEDVINMAIDAATTAGAKLGVGSEAIAKAVKGGLEFVMYAARLATDRVALNDYFKETEAGKAVVDKIMKGFDKTGSKSLKNASKLNLVDIISDAKGYEHTSELIEYTGMTVAQSIVFSASNYNPLAETRLMAITVMNVLGLEKEIGDTSAATVEKVFKGFKMSR
ncbi:MAG: hypothetical protein IKS16_04385 [Lachnospiraceae bacterium]|nr:hypothetical protein [Lachnospiraceae bacterium]